MLRDYQNNMLARVRAAGGEIIGVTSMAQADADKAAKSWGIAYPLLADPSCTLVDLMNARGWITSVVERSEELTAPGGALAAYTGQYAVGMLQPGVLALRGPVTAPASSTAVAPLPQPQVLVTWGSVPSEQNVNGARGRLPAQAAWRAIEKSLEGDFSQAKPPTVQTPAHDGPAVNTAVFWFLLMARGNFVRPNLFVMDLETAGDGSLGGRTLKHMLREALGKAAVAVVLTATGLWRAPVPTASALAAYAAYFFSPGGPHATLTTIFTPSSAQPTSRL